jgi:hypothetical protein
VTDLGAWTDDLVEFLGHCDAALIEANYCPDMLEWGPYPEHLKRRVRGPLGHLANDQTAALVARLQRSRLGRVYLGHLSRSNNTPDRALEVVRTRAGSLPVEVIPHAVPRAFTVEAGRPHLRQLALPFAAAL